MLHIEHNKDTKGDYLISKLLDGENIALISDAGMPGIFMQKMRKA